MTSIPWIQISAQFVNNTPWPLDWKMRLTTSERLWLIPFVQSEKGMICYDKDLDQWFELRTEDPSNPANREPYWWWNQALWGNSYFYDSVAYVQTTWNNATAEIGNPSLPFQTIDAAVVAVRNARVTRWLVYVRAWTYTENVNIRNRVDFYFERGATLTVWSGRTLSEKNTEWSVFSVFGFGRIERPWSNPVSDQDAFNLSRAGTRCLYFEAEYVENIYIVLSADKYFNWANFETRAFVCWQWTTNNAQIYLNRVTFGNGIWLPYLYNNSRFTYENCTFRLPDFGFANDDVTWFARLNDNTWWPSIFDPATEKYACFRCDGNYANNSNVIVTFKNTRFEVYNNYWLWFKYRQWARNYTRCWFVFENCDFVDYSPNNKWRSFKIHRHNTRPFGTTWWVFKASWCTSSMDWWQQTSAWSTTAITTRGNSIQKDIFIPRFYKNYDVFEQTLNLVDATPIEIVHELWVLPADYDVVVVDSLGNPISFVPSGANTRVVTITPVWNHTNAKVFISYNK